MLTLRALSRGTPGYGPTYISLARAGCVSLDKIIAWMGGRNVLPPEAQEKIERSVKKC